MEDDDGRTIPYGSVYTFGQNSYGELSHCSLTRNKDSSTPKLVTAPDSSTILPEMIQVSCGNEFTAILDINGYVWTVGCNTFGQCGTSEPCDECLLKKLPTISNINNIIVANGSEHMLAITTNGKLYAWGNNNHGQCGITASSSVPIIVPTPVEFPSSTNVAHAAVGYHQTVVVTDKNRLLSYGSISDNVVPRNLNHSVTSVSCGKLHVVLSLANGSVFGFGNNDFGQLGVETGDHLRKVVDATKAILNVACGYFHTLLLNRHGNVFSFGQNTFGQLGLGHVNDTFEPTIIQSLVFSGSIVQVACGSYHSLVLNDRGQVFPFGLNNFGQLGLGNTTNAATPAVILEDVALPVRYIAAGFYHSAMITGLPKLVDDDSSIIGLRQLSLDFKKLVNNPDNSDVAFMVDAKPVYAHRCILSARSTTLNRMLHSQMKEGVSKGFIEIPNYPHDVFVALMEYFYTNSVSALDKSSSPEFVLYLYKLADQYLVQSLKRYNNIILESVKV